MTLSPEVAAVLRQALVKADDLSGIDDRQAYRILAEVIENLLSPISTNEFAAHLAKYRRPAGQEGPAF